MRYNAIYSLIQVQNSSYLSLCAPYLLMNHSFYWQVKIRKADVRLATCCDTHCCSIFHEQTENYTPQSVQCAIALNQLQHRLTIQYTCVTKVSYRDKTHNVKSFPIKRHTQCVTCLAYCCVTTR